ncbi:MAG: prolipoprotein diacylglyceryl transferase [Hyphomicrobiaceae bacterium]
MIETLAFLTYPAIDPVAIEFGPISIKWYGLSYMFGLLLGWQYVKRLLATPKLWLGAAPLKPAQADDLLLWLTLAVVLGGRLGQVLLYDPEFYFANPAEIVKVWKGGMSFHGALIASAMALILFARQTGAPVRSVMDLASAGVPFGLFLGRIANFINSEHWGRETDAAVGMIFPNGGPLPRHPSQLYEAALEGLVMFVLLRYITHTKFGLKRPGLVAGVFLVWYAIARTICEFFREPEAVHVLNIGPFTAGQMYSIPMLLLGIYFIATARPAEETASDKDAGTEPDAEKKPESEKVAP